MGWWPDAWKWLTDSPLGVTVFGGVLVALVLGLLAKISSRFRTLLRLTRGAVRRFFRLLGDMRLRRQTTMHAELEAARRAGKQEADDSFAAAEAERLKSPPPPVRFAARVLSGRHHWQLSKTGNGIARNVRLESYSVAFNLMGDAAWDELSRGNHMVDFFGQVTDKFALGLGILVDVHWVDEHDQNRNDQVTIQLDYS